MKTDTWSLHRYRPFLLHGKMVRDTNKSPQNYVLTNAVVAAIESTDKATTTEVLSPIKQGLVEFGNIYFPKLMDPFKAEIKDGVGYKTLDKDTAEFVTSKDTYAQAFEINKGLRLSDVMLAMHKFGGKVGSLWLNVVKDIGGKPSMTLLQKPLFC